MLVAAMATVIVHVPVRFVPSVLLANTFAVPVATAVTRPDEFTVATDVLLDDHVNVLLVAFEGAIAVVICAVAPGASVVEPGINVIPAIKIGFGDTDTATVLYTFDPSVAWTVMMAEPAATDVIRPELDTVATLVLLDDHESVLLATFDGIMVVLICCVCAIAIETVLGLTVIVKIRVGAISEARYAAKLVP